MSQADLWLNGDLTVPIPLAATAPWPEALLTFTPHGFRPAVSGPALVPVTAPGLPLLMAAAKTIAGHCAMFLVTPLSGALLVWITFAIGRRLVSDAVGLAAAWLVATSPAVLAMLVSPMSDVPAAAFWAGAMYFTLGSSSRSALMAGLAASAAILIRPESGAAGGNPGDMEILDDHGRGWPEGQHYDRRNIRRGQHYERDVALRHHVATSAP